LPNATIYLKPGITLQQLNAAASKMGNNDAAAALIRRGKYYSNPLPMHASDLLNDVMIKYKSNVFQTRLKQNLVQILIFSKLLSDLSLYWKMLCALSFFVFLNNLFSFRVPLQ